MAAIQGVLSNWFGTFHPTMFVLAGFGAALLYSRWGKDAVGIYVPRDVIRTFNLTDSRNTQIEFLLFILIGSIIAVLAASPATARQAFAAGLGWTGLFTIPLRQKEGKDNDPADQAAV